MSGLTHFDEKGKPKMVDVGSKPETERRAVAGCRVYMRPETFQLILDKKIAKGDVLSVAQVAGIMAAKKTSELIPMCHPLNITSVEMSFNPDKGKSCIDIQAVVKVTGKTGVEMEALTAVAVAGLTVYDMCKAVDKDMTVADIRLMEKSGGKSGAYKRNE